MTTSPRGCPDATGRSTWWDGVEWPWFFRVALIAGDHVDQSDRDLPDDPRAAASVLERQDPSGSIERQALIVALATAVVERGGVVVVPANVAVAHLVALACYPHARPHAAEDRDPHRVGRDRPPTPVQVLETGGFDPGARVLLAPFMDSNVLTYEGADAQLPVGKLQPEAGDLLRDRPHHPFVPALAEGCLGLVVLSPDRSITEDVQAVADTEVRRTVVLGRRDLPDGLEQWAAAHDPTRELLDDDDGGPGPGLSAPGYVMERLIDDWLS